MNAPIFGHGQLRLYLLSLLDEGPMSGYDVIRTLEERFEGLYSPSAGTIYPRLAKLEEEGLVTRIDEGRRSIYEITDAGRAELHRRSEEVAGLDSHVQDSSARLAEELRRKVTDGASSLWAQLESAAKDAKARAETEEEPSEAPDGSTAERGKGSGTFGGLPIEAWESMARDLAGANRLRREYGGDLATFAQWAAAGLSGQRGGSWWATRPGQEATGPETESASADADATGGEQNPPEDEILAEVVDIAEVVDTEDTPDDIPVMDDAGVADRAPRARPENGDRDDADADSGRLDEDQVRRVIDILRTAADDLERVLRG